MSQAVATVNGNSGIIATMAHEYGLEANRFLATIKATVFPQGKEVSLEQTAAFLVVANQYKLNPFIKEIYAFPGRSGGIVPIVSVDGWATLINRQEHLDGIQFEDHLDESVLTAVTCRIYRKDRSHPTEVTEYMSECKRDTDTWRKWPARMLRHKALIQCARYAFGLVGIYDPDEAERIASTAEQDTKPLDMPKRRSETAAVESHIIDAELVTETTAAQPATKKTAAEVRAETIKLRKAITEKYEESVIERHTGGRDITALNLDQLVELQDALVEEQRD